MHLGHHMPILGKCMIRMGKNLAKLCISLARGYGFLIAKAVERLSRRKTAFKGSELVKSDDIVYGIDRFFCGGLCRVRSWRP
jgi:hypothetical protein